jgi:site-specific DNA-adenine methylase
MINKVFSLLNYIGHKSKILDQIMVHFPKTLKGTFWDVFSGSCVVGLSTSYDSVHFVDNNKYLQELYSNLDNPNFLIELENMISKYNLTNSYRKPRADYLKDPNIGTCTWQGKTIPNLHLDQLNKAGYNCLIGDFNTGKFSGLKRACAYMILTIYGRNSSVSLKKDGNLSGGIGPLDFSPRAKKKFDNHIVAMSGRNLTWSTGTYKDFKPAKNDFVYMDPPYLASGFKYAGWTEEDELSLLSWIDNLPCAWALSNAFVYGTKSNIVLQQWAQKKTTINIQKKYRKWASKGQSTMKKKNKRNAEVLILP